MTFRLGSARTRPVTSGVMVEMSSSSFGSILAVVEEVRMVRVIRRINKKASAQVSVVEWWGGVLKRDMATIAEGSLVCEWREKNEKDKIIWTKVQDTFGSKP